MEIEFSKLEKIAINDKLIIEDDFIVLSELKIEILKDYVVKLYNEIYNYINLEIPGEYDKLKWIGELPSLTNHFPENKNVLSNFSESLVDNKEIQRLFSIYYLSKYKPEFDREKLSFFRNKNNDIEYIELKVEEIKKVLKGYLDLLDNIELVTIPVEHEFIRLDKIRIMNHEQTKK